MERKQNVTMINTKEINGTHAVVNSAHLTLVDRHRIK